jgi:tripartite ATP-independent transporter DctM subunit
MDPFLLSILGVAGMFVLIALHVPIGIAMALAGFAGVWALLSLEPALSLFSTVPNSVLPNQELAAIPMYLLMGSFASAAGLSRDLYRMFYAVIGHWRGGLAMATIAGCGGFGAVCGSSIATASTFMRIALPEMLERNYRPSLATGCIAAGGTLGILIPPSTLMVLYGVLTEQFIVSLFTAAIIPGLVTIALYIVTIGVLVRMDPDAGPPGARVAWRERFKVLADCWGVMVLAAIVSGGIYTGIFTVLESAAVGCIVALGFTAQRGRLNRQVLRQVLVQTAASTALIYVIIIGANVFSFFMTLTRMPDSLVDAINAAGLPPLAVIFLLLLMYIILGCIFDTVAAMILTLPVVFPLVVGLGYDPVWWGVINIMVIEIGLITPPIGVQVFVIHGMAPQIPMATVFRGITPFFLSDLVRLTIITLFPALSLWLPAQLGLLV